MRLIRPADWSAQPWRNGGGVTREVARGGGPGEAWTHRISVAEVASDGPFSRFDGVDRWLMLLDGPGFALHAAAGWTRRVERPFEPFEFAGEAAIECRLLGGPVRDFNVMVRRGAARAELQVARLASGGWRPTAGVAEQYLFVLEGTADLTGPGRSEPLAPLDGLALDGMDPEAGVVVEGPALVAVVLLLR